MSVATEIQRIQTAKADIKTAIENKGVEVGDGKIDTYAEKISQISSGGGDSHYDTFWNSVQENGKRTNYNYAFYGMSWNNTTFKPKYDFKTATSAISMFQANSATEIPEIYMPFVTALTSTFASCKASKINKITVSEACTFTSTFIWCSRLEEIEFGSTISNSISFEHCTVLSKKSFENIVSHLSDTTTGFTVAFSKTAINTAFGIDVDDTSTWAEGSEYYTLRHSKDNWTFIYNS